MSFTVDVDAGIAPQICIIVKDSSPAGAPFGAQNLNTVTATFSYTNSAPALPNDVLTRTDLTNVGNPITSGLELLKVVDKAIASPSETITYTLTYTNNGIGALDDIVIYDSTPAFTTFAAAPMLRSSSCARGYDGPSYAGHGRATSQPCYVLSRRHF